MGTRRNDTASLRRAYRLISRLIAESTVQDDENLFSQWFSANADKDFVAKLGNGDAAIGRSVLQELWNLDIINGDVVGEELQGKLRFVKFYTLEQANQKFGLPISDVDQSPSEDEWEEIEDFFRERGNMAREVQYVDSDGCFGYGVVVL